MAIDVCRVRADSGERAAQISVVNFYGKIVFDSLINPGPGIESLRYEFTGITTAHTYHAPKLGKVAQSLIRKLKGRRIVGHGAKSDLKLIKLQRYDPTF